MRVLKIVGFILAWLAICAAGLVALVIAAMMFGSC